MLRLSCVALTVLLLAPPVQAVEFLGIELCKGGVKTAVRMPAGSALKLESVSVGKHGGLVMVLSADNGAILNLIDELMSSYTGAPGSGNETMLQWSGGQLFALASLKQDGRAVLAVSTSDECLTPEQETAASPAPAPEPTGEKAAPPSRDEVLAGTMAAVQAVEQEQLTQAADFELRGALKHSAAEDGWVDVMGIVSNGTGTSYRLATFDLSLFDAEQKLICVDTISVSVLKAGQRQPFRDSIQCPDYAADAVASYQLHFAGGF